MPPHIQVEWINNSKAIERLAGNQALFKKLLTIFVRNYATLETTIEELLNKKKFTELNRLFHNLAGSAGIIEAQLLREHAFQLELEFEKKIKPDQEKIDTFLKIFRRTIDSIQKIEKEI